MRSHKTNQVGRGREKVRGEGNRYGFLGVCGGLPQGEPPFVEGTTTTLARGKEGVFVESRGEREIPTGPLVLWVGHYARKSNDKAYGSGKRGPLTARRRILFWAEAGVTAKRGRRAKQWKKKKNRMDSEGASTLRRGWEGRTVGAMTKSSIIALGQRERGTGAGKMHNFRKGKDLARRALGGRNWWRT